MPIKKVNNIDKKIQKIEDDLAQSYNIVLEQVGKEAVNFMKEYIDKNWYDEYEPKLYERSYQFRDSISYNIEHKNTKYPRLYIFWDMRKLISKKTNTVWSQHKSFDWDGGQPFKWELVEWIDSGGFEGGVKYNPRRYDGGINVSYATSQFINKIIEKEATKRFKYKIRTTK